MEDGKHHSLSRQDGEYIWPRGRTRRSGSPTLLALTVLAGLSCWLFPNSYWDIEAKASSSPGSENQFSWAQLTPSESLEYHDCFSGFQCARLDVPMDYHRSDGQGTRMAIAIARLPAKVPVTDPRYGGAILINPGTSVSVV
jgi:hypothetical protein